MRAWEIRRPGIDGLVQVERPAPRPGPGEVLVRVAAVALNYRDLATVRDPLSRGIALPRVPCSDGAGVVLAVGPGASRVKPGDRVISCFFQAWEAGAITPEAMGSALGGPIDGVLAEEVVLREGGVTLAPAHLSFAEAACLPCAALTAWHALVESGGLRPGETVLCLGTGGVSVFALQIARLLNAQPIVVSGSPAKLERAAALGAAAKIDRSAVPEWEKAVSELTRGRGVDHVVEVGGGGTLARSIAATRVGGHIALIGILAAGTVDPTPIMRKSIRLQGIYVGSRAMQEAMVRAFEAAELRPVIDRRFRFEEATDAFRALERAQHFGKILIEL
ncbi:MAG: NAD(P)-dependent alcohol dehydrogenase [Geminicoccaceae bacterium]|nr:NAD(P)-dependent alcohol dehydrogenase [Geminicoccaceae bacterium]